MHASVDLLPDGHIVQHFWCCNLSKCKCCRSVHFFQWNESEQVDSVACEQQLQVSVNATSRWLSDWRLTVNTDKTVVMEFTRRPIPSDLAINLNGTQLRKVKEQRHLGLILSSDLRWTEHTNRVLSKAARLLHTLRRLRNLALQASSAVLLLSVHSPGD